MVLESMAAPEIVQEMVVMGAMEAMARLAAVAAVVVDSVAVAVEKVDQDRVMQVVVEAVVRHYSQITVLVI